MQKGRFGAPSVASASRYGAPGGQRGPGASGEVVVVMDSYVESGRLKLAAHLARPKRRSGNRRPGLVLCHGFPAAARGARQAGSTYAELADWLASEAGWAVLAFNFRGAGTSEGQFSLGGWLGDLRAAVSHLRSDPDVDGVWLAGFRDGGSLAVCLAGQDPQVRGVAALAARVDFDRWAADPRRLLEQARRVGVVSDPTFPRDFDSWSRELRELRPLRGAAAIPPRPFLVVHGTDDAVVPLIEARAMADVYGDVEFRVLNGAGHHLRHDPRAVAILLGWLERQGV